MLYFLFVCGILLVLLSIYSLFRIEKARDNPNYKAAKISAWICLLIGAIFIIIPRSVWKSEKSVLEVKAKKEVVRLTLQDFLTAYAQSASLFGAQSGFVMNIESGEKADIAKAKINDISSINISLERTSEKKLLGVMIFVGNSSDSAKMWEALKATYAIVKIFETDRSTESIPEFVQKLLNMDSGSSTSGNNVIYTVNQALGNTILSIRYPTE